MKTNSFKILFPHIAAILFFAAVSFAYFSPALEGKELVQDDVVRHLGMSKEISDFRSKTGTEALWTNSMFGGMPAFQISVLYNANLAVYLEKIYRLGVPYPFFFLFVSLLGFYILLIALEIDPLIAVLGSVAFAFSSYFFIIIAAGHTSKAIAISYMAPVIAGVALIFRGRLLAGGVLTSLFLAFEIGANHLQITYYLFIFLMIYLIFVFVRALLKKEAVKLIKPAAVLCASAILALGCNITGLWCTYDYSKLTTRGKSDLTSDKENKTNGLDRDYITAWSYGIGESMSLLIPDIKGGATGVLGSDKKAMNAIDPQYRQSVARQNHYWGDQPFTSGPVYAGAFVCFLFVLGIFIVDAQMKYILLAATVLSIILAWGKNYMGFTNLFLHFFPGYDKFRTVTMTLVIAELSIPLLGVLAFKKVMDNPHIIKQKRKLFIFSLLITAGAALLNYSAPSAFNELLSGKEMDVFAQQAKESPQYAGQISEFTQQLEIARTVILKSDALRSLLFILFAAGLMVAYSAKVINARVFALASVLLILADMWGVDKRYLNSELFIAKSRAAEPYPPTNADKMILADKDPDFRVLNLAVNTFNDASTSYFHKSIGGYHGAKLKRYQELIDFHISRNNMAVLNMLNTKYFIVPDTDKQPVAKRNTEALGNAWFVKEYRLADNADSEISALNGFNPASTAIIDKRFSPELEGLRLTPDSLAKIALTFYSPNKLTYHSSASAEQLAVFSEIYYAKGWNAYSDGKPVSHVRANYVLRAMRIPAGVHEIEFRFEPVSFYAGEKIALISSLLLILLIAGAVYKALRKPHSGK